MRWTSKAICVCALSIILAGCGNDLDCANSGAKELVEQIAKDHSAMVDSVRMATFNSTCGVLQRSLQNSQNANPPEMVACREKTLNVAVNYNLDAIRTTDKNEATGAVACAANLHAVAEKYESSAEEPITYKLEKTSDGQLYATVFGVSNTGFETRH